MTVSSLLLFMGVQALGLVAPGPDFVLILRNSLRSGAVAGYWTSTGIAAGVFVWIIATTAGIGGVLVASRTAFDVLRYAGALYLLYLGISTLISAFRGSPVSTAEATALTPLTAAAALRQGFLCNALNPKAAVFFLALIPQLLGTHVSAVSAILIALVGAAMTAGWFAFVSRVAQRLGVTLARPRAAFALNVSVGVILSAIAAALAFSG